MTLRSSLSLVLLLLLAGALAACGGSQPAATSAPAGAAVPTNAARPAETQSGAMGGPTTPAATPVNVVPTTAAGAANTSFQTARTLGKDPVEFGVKESQFYFKVDVARGGVISATLTTKAGSPAPATLTFHNETQEYIKELVVPVGKSGLLRHIFDAKGGGTVFLLVKGESNVTLRGQALTQNDGASGGDASNEIEKPTRASLGTLTGMLGDADREDDYQLDVPKDGGMLSWSVKTSDGSLQLELYGDNGLYVGGAEADGSRAEPGTGRFVFAGGQGGRIIATLKGEGTYTLSTAFAAQNDGGSGKDAGPDMAGAAIAKSGTVAGLLGNLDAGDTYKIPAALGRVVSVKFVKGTGTLRVALYDKDGNYSKEGNVEAGQSLELKEQAGKATDDYYVELGGADGEYIITLNK